ncbi:hypothetical protein O6H91_01G046300 [Diphasiastrum complanatum]|uniref:Uncharacterized protein n=1 Tax=Diphasiastrum complanatum TaxID=34168 RepID=A0ACC2EQI8_DIPCM|nr:hypothetical protein O6H91_01G046300 [Diphasiastrum complanatum]
MADFTSKSDQLPLVSPSSSSSSLHSPLLHNSIVVASASSPAPPIPAAAAPWGLHSPAANRFAAAKNDDDGMGDFGRYMSEKKRKLREQFQADFSSHLFGHVKAPVAAECLSNEEAGEHSLIAPKGSFEGHLFKGVSIFVNGFTIPSHSELRGLMMKYGGRFENYFSRSRVTHIVCSTLPDSKIKDSRSFSRGLPIVKPDWIVDSIAQGKLLHWASYQPERIAYAHPHQQKLSSFFGSDSGGEIDKEKSLLQLAVQSSSEVEPGLSDKLVSVLDVEKKHSCAGAINDTLQTTHAQVNEENLVKEENKDNYAKEEESKSTATAEEASSDSSTNEDVCHNWENAVDNESLLREDDSSSGKGNDHQNMASYAGHSTLVDKNFVQNFFKRSRLHFIGTWRSRYHGHVEDKPRPINESLSNQTPAIIHIDMDCFFVAVVVRNRPQMAGKPVAVCHSDSARGTAEISSANYTARAHGVHAGMFVRDAKACCPSLEIVPYDFEGYEEVAEKLYDILHKHCNQVQALSCDEAYLDVTGQGNPELIAESIRSEIFDATKCTASAGIATNVLLARLATKRAKPNGQYYVKADEEEQFMADLPVGELPGVGWALKEKLHSRNLCTCHQLRTVSKV